MSKSPKTVRQGDERNLYLRRLKTPNAPLKHADPNDRLTVKQSDSTRTNIVGTSQRSNVPPGKNFKSKLTSPIKPKTIKSSKLSNHHYLQTLKVNKRLQSSSINHLKARTMKVQHQEGGDSAVSHSKGLKKEMPKGKNKSEENADKEREKKVENNQVDGPVASNTNGKAPESGSELQSHSENNVDKESKDKAENNIPTEVQTTKDSKHDEEVIEIDSKSSNGKEEASKPEEKHADGDQPRVEIEIIDVSEKIESERQPTLVIIEEESSAKSKKEECLSGSDIVESTTSESPPGQQSEIQKSQGGSQNKDDEISFISYDSNIMLKDVQIKLNDCLKDNSKLFDTTDPNASMSENFKDQSFGRTLRGISGRTSLGRLRNVTVRERRMSPNDSLFVNTSRISISQDRSIYENADSSPLNYSRFDRKRKRVADTESSTKKFKVEEGYSFLNFSWDYLKHWRRSDQISTPNTKEFKLNLDDNSKIEDNMMNVEETTEPKKWCIIM